MSDADNRYKALIQPIKDIAANWDIDIAESLTEYLEELDHLRISIDGGKNNLNFAEAALLIQGSTAVYSKKVEYLHQLVLQSLEFITNKKTTNTIGGQSKANRSSAEDDDLLVFDTEASFLLLDHIVEEGQNINLKAAPPSTTIGRNGRISNSFSSADNNTSRVSMSLMHSLLSDDQGTASLKLSTSMVDGSGALLVCGALPTGNSKLPMGSRASLQNSFHEQSRIQNSSSFHADEAPLVGDDVDFYDDGHDDGGGGGDWGYDEPEPMVPACVDGETVHPFTVSSRPVDDSPNRNKPRKAHAPQKDMFAQLDPHSVVSGSREVRRGKTYKVPRSNTAAAAPSSSSSSLRVEHLYADYKPSNVEILCTSGTVPLKGLFNLALLPVLAAKRKQVRKERMLQMRLQRLAAMNHSTPQKEQYQNFHLAGDAGATVPLNASRHEELWAQDYADYGSDAGGNDDYGGDFVGDAGGDDYEGPSVGEGDIVYDQMRFPTEGEDYLQESEEEALARRVANVLNDELNESTRTSYESICQKYIDNFNQGANLFAKETQLSRRVAEWTQRLEPILQQQEEAAQFDIHAYCEQFLDEVNEVTAEHEATHVDDHEFEEPVSFGEVVAGKPSGEVCRIFLACLQLVNHGNVSITPAEGVDQWTFAAPSHGIKENRRLSTAVASDPFTVKVNVTHHGVSRERADVENYLAPSLNDKRGGHKSAMKGSGKGKGTKRVHVDIPSNMFISI